ncbi:MULTISPECIES: serine/threonine protein kinase [Rhodanobacteraceae]|uniref:serine/threonine protein kinase n=1 Tax=Rhodanobacteraceae TaxID=1775411 RepID=UPI000891411A|nr:MULTISPECIES: serine/threonine protein kinase [Rhodanobacteraceae]SDG05799.1 Ser/Thr protein kinase RdoA involved in Cpx stress response, MazF antagonist [Dyella sp. 333MFSha]SKB29334.1 Ser/Thr protein kinase RdoA involved in Cpx stress response, MazF antagonist [Luteibacter sp. 22Crub2.1]
MSESAPYAALSPDVVLAAVDATGTWSDGRLLTLNSYENRVFQVGLDDGGFVVAKFYRPGRWTDAAIEEEHAFALELAAAELPMVAPLAFDGRTMLRHEGYRYAVYPRRGGRAPSLESADQLEWLGRLLGRMHAIGARQPFRARTTLDRATMIDTPMRAALGSDLLPAHLFDAYRNAASRVDDAVANRIEAVGPVHRIRLHGDCHPGNVLWTDAGPHFVDLDDARMGPAVQDLWMLAGDDAMMDALLEGYGQFRDFDPTELALVPALRAMRQVHYAGWIAERWHDPAFPAAFPFAAEPRWWEQHIADLHDIADDL